MPARSAATLRWRNVALATAWLATGAGLATLAPTLWPRDAAPAGAAAGLPDNRIDLRDNDSRWLLELIASRARNRYADLAPPLFWRCDSGAGDTIVAGVEFAFEAGYYVEIRRGVGTDASALLWQDLGWGLPPPPPPPGQEYVVRKLRSAGTPIPRTVPDIEFAAILDEFVDLSLRGAEPLRGQEAFDGGIALIEICHGGRYGVFVRQNAFWNADDRRILALTERVLAAAGVHERQQQHEAPPGLRAL
jgi:hypothetical protein